MFVGTTIVLWDKNCPRAKLRTWASQEFAAASFFSFNRKSRLRPILQISFFTCHLTDFRLTFNEIFYLLHIKVARAESLERASTVSCNFV